MSGARGRRFWGFAILVVWAGVVGWHVRREYFRPQSELLAEAARGLGPGSHFYTVRMDGVAVGLASSRLDTLPDGFVFEDLLALDVPALDSVHRATVRTRLVLDPALALREFSFDLDSEIGRFRVRGSAAPDSGLAVEVSAGSETPTRVRLPSSTLLSAALPLRLAAGGGLRVGHEVRARVFDPSSLEEREVSVRVTARDTLLVPDSTDYDFRRAAWRVITFDTVPAWEVEERWGGVQVRSWVDEDGRLVRAESPLGLALERTAFELARAAWEEGRGNGRGAGYGRVIESTAIAADAPLDGTTERDSLAVRLLGVGLEGLDLGGGRQSLSGDTLVVRREAPEPTAGYALPWRGGGEAAAELGSTPLIQSDDPRIVARARAIAGEESDPVRAARALNGWVYRELRKDVTLSVPSAVQVLDAREGDCNEHTVLYVALARALGLPARTAVGLVHLRGRFYYHAWPEVWLDGRWVAVDPTLGQFPADATHLRFLVGGLARQVELVRLIGRLDLEVL